MSEQATTEATLEQVVAVHQEALDAAIGAETQAALGGIQQQVESKRPNIIKRLENRALDEIIANPDTSDITKICQVYAVKEKGVTPEALELAGSYETHVVALNKTFKEAGTIIRYGQVLGKPEPGDTEISIEAPENVLVTAQFEHKGRGLHLDNANTRFDIPSLFTSFTPKEMFKLRVITDTTKAKESAKGESRGQDVIVGTQPALTYAEAILSQDLTEARENPDQDLPTNFALLLESAFENGNDAFYKKLQELPGASNLIALRKENLIEAAKLEVQRAARLFISHSTGLLYSKASEAISAIERITDHHTRRNLTEIYGINIEELRKDLLTQHIKTLEAKKQEVLAPFHEQEKALNEALGANKS